MLLPPEQARTTNFFGPPGVLRGELQGRLRGFMLHRPHRYQTLDGRAYKSTDRQWTFTIELLQDWGATSSLFEAMWADAETAPNTALNVSFTAATGAVFAFTVLPIFPSAGGAAPGALTDTWTMTVIGTPTETFS